MKVQSSYSKIIGVMIQILVWAVFALVLFFYQPYLSNIDVPYQFWLKQVIILCMLVVAYYVNSVVLVPNFLLKNRTGYYFMIIALLFVIIIFVTAQVDKSLHVHRLMDAAFHKRWEIMNEGKSGPPKPGKGGGRGGLDTISIAIIALVLGISTSVTTIQKWQKDKQEREELEKDKVTSELSFLKAQINPHFFFNTLNNIYALTVVDAEVAGKAIHQLSRMMRYLLYDTQSGHTMLSQEIAFVKDYISLMQLRLTDVVKVNIDTPSNLKDEPIAPMIFLPFVENAFKHGVSATQNSHVDIIIWQRDKVLDLTVKNSIMNDNSVSLDTNSGIGLVNTKRRLDLLYPGKYKLDVSEVNAANEYTVHLTIDLS
jgi:two-component system LytT family sensor kinase